MPVASRSQAGRKQRISAARLAVRASGFAVLWAVLSGGEGWIVGVPAVLIATAATPLVAPASRLSVPGLLRFIPYFLWNSLRGGVDVAARALHPGLPVDPAIVRYEMGLDTVTARVLMANTVTLLPGTLSANLNGNILSVHVLYVPGPVIDLLGELERRVADVFRHDDGTGRR